MKKSLHDKFKENANFVKPLYRKVKFGNRVKPMKKLLVSVDTKPCSNGLHVKRKTVTNKSVDYNVIEVNSENCDFTTPLPGACDRKLKSYYSRFKFNKHDPTVDVKVRKNAPFTTYNLLRTDYMKMDDETGSINNKSIQAKNSAVFIEKVPETWLRVYPAPQTPNESTLSVIFRCVVCQFGLAAILVMWNILWVLVIHHFEGPYETAVSIQFEKEQNQLVIDLATELRQITPLSPKWKYAIEKRIEDERLLTMMAMARGAKLHPGQFWDLSGTFLFCVYVMTALGFGAPVPQTAWGRSSALIYALLAVPIHIYLMMNVSTCVVTKVEVCIGRWRRYRNRQLPVGHGNAGNNNGESPNCSRNSELKAESGKAFNLRRKIERVLSWLSFGRCVPATMAVYYASGAVAFGALRGRRPLECVMFPLEFTTTGGLEHVSGHVRILYGLYVEGAMTLLACALAAMRARSSVAVNYMSEKYRLFTINKQQ